MEAMAAENMKTGRWVIPGYNSDVAVQLTARKPTIYGQILDEEKALEYFEQSARVDEMVKTSVVAGRLNALVREWITNKTPLPPGIGFREDTGVTVTKRPK
jgi:hypothetical protein